MMALPQRSFDAPILFLVFNRPDTTMKVFETIRQVQPRRLYIAGDGPRSQVQGEEEKVKKVRDVVAKIDWDCEVKTLFREKNIGCKQAVSTAISWFFEHEEEGIILEDDCLPDQSFFTYCSELLERYRNDNRIMCISGNNFQDGHERTKFSYYFSRYTHIWGWATWKRAWDLCDQDLLAWPEVKKDGFLGDVSESNDAFEAYWERIFDKCHLKEIDTWDYPWLYSCWLQSGLTILPHVNLVSNIGFGEGATHTKAKDCKHADLYTESIQFPLVHPQYVTRDYVADRYTDKNILGIKEEPKPLWCRISRRFLTSVMSTLK